MMAIALLLVLVSAIYITVWRRRRKVPTTLKKNFYSVFFISVCGFAAVILLLIEFAMPLAALKYLFKG